MRVAVTAVEMGLVEVQEPETEIAIDTPAGVVRTIVHVKDGKATSVSLQVVPSFHYRTARVDVPGIGSMTVDIASAGNMIAVVDAGEMGIETTASGVRSARDLIVETIEAINTQVEIDDPEKGPIKASVSALMIGDKPSDPIANVKNVAVTKDLFIDRSPCGTGTSGKLATLHAKGELKVGETVVVESVIGSHFHARLVEEVKVRKKTAVVPELTGRVFITGMHQFTLDPDDPFKHGYLM